MFKYILILFILFTSISHADKQPSKEQVTNICTTHYSSLLIDIIGALNIGMSVDDVKKNLSGKDTISKQMSILFTLVDLLPTNKEQAKYDTFNTLVNQCVVDNFNKPRQV